MPKTVEELEVEIRDLMTKVGEFRDNNLKLTTALERFGDMTPEDVAEAGELKAARERKELVDSKDIEAALDKQAAQLKEDFERRFEAVSEELNSTKGSLREVSVTSVLKTLAASAGVRVEAIDDVVNTFQGQFESVGTELVLHEDGKPVLSKANAGANMLAAEFLEGLATSKPFYFDSSGGGGGEQEARRTQGGKRTISREQWQSGEFNTEIREGKVVVEGYTEDVQTAA